MLNEEETDLVSLFKSFASQYPETVAIEDCTKSIANPPRVTYGELDECSSSFAQELKQNGVRPGDAIPLLSRRSPEAIIAILAILKCEACYVPMDADSWAQDRIQTTLQQIQPHLIVSTNSVQSNLNLTPWKVLEMSSWKTMLASTFVREHQRNIWQDIAPPVSKLDRLAYIIFTSGTTGMPKGVMVTMRSITAYCKSCDPDLPFNPSFNANSRVLCVVSIAFDACVGIIFSTMTRGGTLILADPATFAASARQCTVLPLTPSILSSLDPDGFDSIKAIYLGGESPSPALIQAWSRPGRRIFNAYGPTEATCATLLSELSPGGPITIGWPIWYSKVILIDSEGKRTEEEGEIYVGGTGLGVGYYGNDKATNKSFVIHDGERFYRTGDLARLTPDGYIFRGRMDSMVKNRGFLVNLEAEVEPAILSIPDITGAVAMKTEHSLVAFVTPSVDVNTVRKYLSENFSTFLVPDTIYALSEFPQTTNGKTDRKSLLSLHQAKKPIVEPAVSFPSDISFTPLGAVTKAFAFVLRLSEDSAHPETSFLQNGGHSLGAVRLVSILRKLGYVTSLTEILAKDSIGAVAESVASIAASPPAHVSTATQDNAPMTDPQLRMVRATTQSPTLYYIKIGLTFEHPGTPSISTTLRHAWEAIYRGHEILRTNWNLSVEDGVHVITDKVLLNWEESIVTRELWSTACTEAIDINQCRDTLSSFCLITNPGYCTRLVWTVHHSLIDGWSAGKLLGDLKSLINHGQLPHTYPQFGEAARLIKQLAQESEQKASRYWQSIAEGYLPVKRILLAPPPIALSSKVATQAEVHESLGVSVSALEAAAENFGVTSSTIMYAAWALLLSRYCESDKVALGAVVAQRALPVDGIENIVGPLINTLPLCVDTDKSSIGDLLTAVLQTLRDLLDVQYSTYSLIHQATGIKGSDLFETVLAIQYGFPDFGPAGECEMAISDIEFRESTELPLTVLVSESNGILETKLLYSCQAYNRGQAADILVQFHSLVHAIIRAKPQTPLDGVHSHIFDRCDGLNALQMGTSWERNCMRKLDDETFGGPRTVQRAFQESLSCFPDLCAVSTNSRSLSYRDLSCFINIVASYINEVTQPADVICIISDGTIEWLVAILAVIQSGCTYCPVDVKLPRARQQYMIDSASAKVVLFPQANMRTAYGFLGDIKAWDVSSLITQTAAQRNHNHREVEENDIAVIIFTSGSKGVPKAVQLAHKSIMSLLSCPEGRIYSKPGWRIAQTLSLGFDCCVLEVLSATCFGGSLVLKDVDDPLAHLNKVDAMVATPSLLATLEPESHRNLQVVFLLGEALHQNLLDKWRPGRIIQNCYGPAECTLFATYKRFDDAAYEQVSIGKSTPRTRTYILDKKRRPVPLGVKGEIYISGVQVSPGYRNNAVQTTSAFLPDLLAGTFQKMFKTGDMGRLMRDGNIEYIGREDDLFKIRGFRINLEDIEASILALAPDVDNIAVVVAPSADLLIAFVTPMSVNIPILQEKIKNSLPAYMIPTHITALTDLPLSPNHKVDRNKLASMEISLARATVPLTTPTERLIAEIWRELLRKTPMTEQIGASDHFLTMGGHSLLQIRVAQRLSQALNIPFPLRLVIQYPILQDLSQAIHKEVLAQKKCNPRRDFRSFKSVSRTGDLPVSFLEEELLINDLLSGSSPALNILFATEFKMTIDTPMLDQAFRESVREGEVFLSRYKQVQGKFIRNLVYTPSSIRQFSPTELSIDEFLHAARNYRFDLANEQPVKALLYQNSPTQSTLVILMSHLVGDAITMSGFLDSLAARFSAMSRQDLTGPVCSSVDLQQMHTYIDWAAWSTPLKYLPAEALSFWKTYLNNPPLQTGLNQSHRSRSYTGGTKSWTLPSTLSESLRHLCTDLSLSLHQLMLAAVALATQSLRSSQDIVMMAPYSLRTEPLTEQLAGCLLDRVPIRVKWDRGQSLHELLRAVQQASQAAIGHAVPYASLCKALHLPPSLTDSLAEIMVTFHPPGSDKAGRSLGQPFSLRPSGAKFPILFEFVQKSPEETIAAVLEHNDAILSAQDGEALMSAFQLVIQLIAQNQTVRTIVETVYREVRTPAETPNNPVTDQGSESCAERTNKESHVEVIQEAFATCLGMKVEDVGSHTSFFDELGGSSADAVRLVWLLKEKGVIGVDLRQVLLARTPAALGRPSPTEREEPLGHSEPPLSPESLELPQSLVDFIPEPPKSLEVLPDTESTRHHLAQAFDVEDLQAPLWAL
ncbi:Nonribosomal Peptide Synthase (NRPS) [Aspergillus melleus]|uniref:Nonribosomal Peptide Synthase (NRPS) n=1 Tax=Aspergillus melleus TaxID=138277 RepID=A0ACC3AX48_9EURO|nr:Nonribosomal Peptide Synthase (NRPS) [Aspergillus melleus]